MEQQPTLNQRPVFLTIICIISFVGLGLSIIQSFMGLIFISVGEPFFDMAQSNMKIALSEVESSNPSATAFVSSIFDALLKFLEILPVFTGITIILSIIALTGVVLMWMLKKTGFYMYTGAKVFGFFVPVIMLGYNILSIIMTMGLVFTTAIFITLYALNFKALK